MNISSSTVSTQKPHHSEQKSHDKTHRISQDKAIKTEKVPSKALRSRKVLKKKRQSTHQQQDREVDQTWKNRVKDTELKPHRPTKNYQGGKTIKGEPAPDRGKVIVETRGKTIEVKRNEEHGKNDKNRAKSEIKRIHSDRAGHITTVKASSTVNSK